MINLNIRKTIKFLIVIFLILTFLSIFFSCLRQIYIENYVINSLNELFNTNVEANIPTYFSSFLILFNGIIIYLIAKKDTKEKIYYWYLWSFLFLFMSIDELAQFHEKVNVYIVGIKELKIIAYFGWASLYSIIVAIIIFLNIRFLNKLPKTTKAQILIAGFVYITGVIVMEIVGGYYSNNYILYKLCTTIEEFLEMGGMIMFCFVFLNYLYTLDKNIKIKLLKA